MSDALQQMLDELESNRLEVQLVPLNPRLRNYNAGGMKRVAVSRNVKWYSDFCRRHLSSRKRNRRKWDTKIKRAEIIRILRRIADGKPCISKYVEELRNISARLSQAETARNAQPF